MSASNPKVLLVDDDPRLREIVGLALRKAMFECDMAVDGADAKAKLAGGGYDAVITDLKMPRMGGLQLIEWLRSEGLDVPVVIMTGYGDLESARKAIQLGVTEYLLKPFESLYEVQAAVKRAVERPSSRRDTEKIAREFEQRTGDLEMREKHLTRTLEKARIEIDMLAMKLEKTEFDATTSSEAMESIIAELENGILIADMEGRVVSLNEEIRRQMQAPRSAGRGMALDRCPGDPNLRDAIVDSQRLARAGMEEAFNVETVGPGGEPVKFAVRSRRMTLADGGAFIITIVRQRRASATSMIRKPGE